ncbi:MAG: TetR/AcrR family transcriptional regulator [Rhizomicrobium sp.]
MVRHAFALKDKQNRRQAILDAADALFLSGGGALPSAAQIAAKAGLAKGTVYLYFQTKEEIFAALLLEGWAALLQEVGGTLGDGKGRRAARVAAFLQAFIGYLDRHPGLLRLDALGYGVLEKNLEPEKLKAFKSAFLATLARTGTVVERVLNLQKGHGVRVLMRTYALTRGLWQSSRPQGFNKELLEALTEYWRGALAAS